MSSRNTRHGRHGLLQVAPVTPTDSQAPASKELSDTVTVGRITKWEVSSSLRTKSEWSDSDTNGSTARQPGNKDATFSCEGKYITDSNTSPGQVANAYDLFQPGDFTNPALLWLDHKITGLLWYFPRAMNDQFNLVVDIESAEVIGWTAEFGADCEFYSPGRLPDALKGHVSNFGSS